MKLRKILSGLIAAGIALGTCVPQTFAAENAPAVDISQSVDDGSASKNEIVDSIDISQIPYEPTGGEEPDGISQEALLDGVFEMTEEPQTGGLEFTVTEVTEEEAEKIAEAVRADYENVPEIGTYDTASVYTRKYYTDYYYNQLTGNFKLLYDRLRTECESFAASTVNLSTEYFTDWITASEYNLTADEASAVINLFFTSNPQYFFLVNGISYATNTSGALIRYNVRVHPSFQKSSVRQEYQSKINAVTESWLTELNSCSTDREKELLLIKKLAQKINYVLDSEHSQTIAGALVDGECVCSGYAHATTYFCNALGIECVEIESKVHGWNAIRLNGKWYLLDNTWIDKNNSNTLNMLWANRSSAAFTKNDSLDSHVIWSEIYDGYVVVPTAAADDPDFSAYYTITPSIKPGYIDLSWDYPVNAEFSVLKNKNENGVWYYYASTSNKTCRVSNTTASTKYDFCVVTGKTSSGYEVSYEPITVTTPASMKLTGASGYQYCKLTWDEVAGAAGYNIYIDRGAGWVFLAKRSLLSVNITNCPDNVTYKFYIEALDSSGKVIAMSNDTSVTASGLIVTGKGGYRSGRLDWNKYSGASKYFVYTYKSSGWSKLGEAVNNYVPLTGFADNATVKFYIEAVDASETLLAISNEVEITSSPAIPTVSSCAVNTDTVNGTTGITVTLGWNAVTGATKYEVYNSVNKKTYATDKTTCAISGLSTATTYTFKVRAGNASAWSDYSAEKSITTPNVQTNVKPANVKAVGGNKQITLTWNAVSGATQYNVQRKSGSSWSSVNYTTTNSYTDTGLADAATYTYRISAYVNGKWGDFSEEASAKTNAAAVDNTKVTGLTGNGIDKGIVLKWNAVKGATKYRLQQYIGSAWATIAYPTTNTYTHTGLVNGTANSYRVLALVNGAWGTPSAGLKVRVGITVTGFSGKGINKGVVLKWDAVKNATKYRIQRINTSNSWETIGFSNTPTYTDTNLKNGSAYAYRVLAYVDGSWRTPCSGIKVRAGAAAA